MFDCETNHGKRMLTLELGTEQGRARLWELLRVADVLIDGFANGALSRFGFPIDEVLARNPQLVYLDLSCLCGSKFEFPPPPQDAKVSSSPSE